MMAFIESISTAQAPGSNTNTQVPLIITLNSRAPDSDVFTSVFITLRVVCVNCYVK